MKNDRNLVRFCQHIGKTASKRFQANELTSKQMETVYNGLIELGKKSEEIVSIVSINALKHIESIPYTAK